ncbi:MAG: ATP-binding protein, partial [Candidatus Omnitrophica bacterium]|nr:ATP-binding protein [Candidatus Omnitrophota bacterium]
MEVTMRNPFVYGKEVSKENFCNRISEIKELLRDISNSQNVIIFSQRRFGKTSLIKRVFEELDFSRIIPIYVDLYPVLSEEDFIRIYAKALSKTVTKDLADKIKELSSVFKKIRPTYSVDQTGQVSFSIDIKNEDIIPSLEDVLEGLNRYVKKEKKKAVVCFDEFQQVSMLKTDKIEKFMRSVFQSHKNISYIFMGSKKHLIYDM